MATWEDGPEYAPLERPAEFSTPEGQPLEIVPPPEQSAALAPKERPAFDSPEAPVAPLAQLVPVVADQRNPEMPFDVAASTVTSMDSAWGAAHWSPPSGQPGSAPLTPVPPGPTPASQPPWPALPIPAGPPVIGSEPNGIAHPSAYGAGNPAFPPPVTGAGPAWPPPPTVAWPNPAAPVPAVGGPAQLPSGYPPPGTPQWFGPGPAGQFPQQQSPTPTDARAVAAAATPGLLICLAIGGFFQPLSPIMFGVAFFLSQRAKVAQQSIRQAFLVSLGFLGLFAFIGLLTRIWFTDWWGYVAWWALLACWVMLVSVIVLVYRGLKKGQRSGPTPYTSNWG